MCAFCFGQIWQEVVGKHASLIVTLRPHPAMIFVCSKQKHYLLGNPCVSLPTPCGVSSGLISDKIQIPQCESLLTSSMVSATKLDDVSRCTFLWPETDFNRDFTTFHQMTPRQGQDSRNSTCRVFDSDWK